MSTERRGCRRISVIAVATVSFSQHAQKTFAGTGGSCGKGVNLFLSLPRLGYPGHSEFSLEWGLQNNSWHYITNTLMPMHIPKQKKQNRLRLQLPKVATAPSGSG